MKRLWRKARRSLLLLIVLWFTRQQAEAQLYNWCYETGPNFFAPPYNSGLSVTSGRNGIINPDGQADNGGEGELNFIQSPYGYLATFADSPSPEDGLGSGPSFGFSSGGNFVVSPELAIIDYSVTQGSPNSDAYPFFLPPVLYWTSQDSYANLSYNVFGITGGFDSRQGRIAAPGLPEGQYTIVARPGNAGAAGPSVHMAGYTEPGSRLEVNRIRVYGSGADPFANQDDDVWRPCGSTTPPFTPTPTPVLSPTGTYTPFPTGASTNTPTVTLTRTPTGTPSITPTHSPTPQPYSYTIDYTSSQACTSVAGGEGQYTSGVGFETKLVYGSYRVVQVVIDFPETNITSVSLNYTYQRGYFVNSDAVYVFAAGPGSPDYWDVIQIEYYPNNPPASPVTYSNLGLRTRLYIRILAGLGYSDPGGYAKITSITINGTGYNPFPTNCAPPTQTPTASSTITQTPSVTTTRTPLPSTTPQPTTRTPRASNTPNPSVSPTGTLTPLPSTTPQPTITTTPTLIPATSTPNATGTAGFLLTQTQFWATQSTTPTPGITLPAPGPGDEIGSGDGTVGGLVNAGNDLIQRMANLFRSAQGALGDFVSRAQGLIFAWQNSPAVEVPGLPRCKTAPTLSEVCAIYYILTYTIFSGTIGSLIMPLAVIVIDLILIIAFIRFARSILRRIGEVTQL